VPIDSDQAAIDRLKSAPGASLVDFDRKRLKPWTVCDSTVSINLMDKNAFTARWRLDVQNLLNRQYAFNIGDPFEGTHFGAPRIWKMGLELQLKKAER
jgi:outer membrane receptor protein involved in Fe transport